MAQKVQTADSMLGRLKQEVIAPGLCVACGACLGLCPHLLFYDGQVAAPDACTLPEGRCYDLCPVLEPAGGQASRPMLHQGRGQTAGGEVGPSLEAWQAQASQPAVGAQYGGVVTSLMALALEKGLVEEAVVTRSGREGAPEGVRVRQPGELAQAAGSLYAGGGALAQVNQALAEEAGHHLGMVGLPCQVLAAARMQQHPRYPAARRLTLVIGLFCTWNLPLRRLRGLLGQNGLSEKILKCDVPPPPAQVFRVKTAEGWQDIPLDLVRAETFPGCACCPDMTAELADLSVGAAEGRPGWNTLIVRSEAGGRLVELARKERRLLLEPVPEEAWSHLKEASEAKRERARSPEELRG